MASSVSCSSPIVCKSYCSDVRFSKVGSVLSTLTITTDGIFVVFGAVLEFSAKDSELLWSIETLVNPLVCRIFDGVIFYFLVCSFLQFVPCVRFVSDFKFSVNSKVLCGKEGIVWERLRWVNVDSVFIYLLILMERE
jgi:hypothetical protein